MNKDLWIIANWKSNKNIAQALEWISFVGPKIPSKDNVKVVVCPPVVDIEEVKKAVKVGNFPLLVGAQDLSPFSTGAYTGEEAAKLLSELVDLVILGHSERRSNFSETDEIIAQKIIQAQEAGITPLLCVQDIDTPVPEGVKLVAYEPIFAIGTGKPDSPENADQVALQIKEKRGGEISVLYGGSVTSGNATSFLNKPNISGLLVGGASLEAQEFVKIVNLTNLS